MGNWKLHKKSQAQLIEQDLDEIQEKLNVLLIDKAKAKLTRGRRTFYEFGNKPGRMLANTLRETSTHIHIARIKMQKDEMVSIPQRIT